MRIVCYCVVTGKENSHTTTGRQVDKMKYKNIDELDARIERIIDSTVKWYYTDWKNYDRPKYMGFKGSNKTDDKKMILIARESGTYLVRLADIENGDDWANTLYTYFQDQEHATYYFINLNRLEVKRIIPTLTKQELRTA